MKKNLMMNRLIAIILSVSLFVSSFNGLILITGKAATTSGTTGHIADGNTMYTYKQALNIDENSQNAGRVWADKSVFTGDITLDDILLNPDKDGVGETVMIENDSDFLHAFSTIGSTVEIYQDNIPADIVFILDFSASMNSGTDRLEKMLEAVNNAINTVVEKSPNSRIGIVAYSSKAIEILPLSKLVSDVGVTKTNWFAGSKLNTSAGACTVNFTANVQKAESETEWRETELINSSVITNQDGNKIGFQTNLQAGIALGMGMLADEEVTTWYSQKSKETYTRTPAVIIMTDGECNLLCKSNDGKQENAWWNANPDSYYQEDAGDTRDVDEKIEGIAPIIASTAMTAAYNVTRIYDNYYNVTSGDPKENQHVYTYGISVDTNKVSTAQQKIYAILNSSKYFNDDTDLHTTLPDVDSISERITDAYTTLAENVKNSTSYLAGTLYCAHTYEDENDEVKAEHLYPVEISFDALVDYTPEQIFNNIHYTDSFYDANKDEQNEIFDRIVKEVINVNMFIPVGGMNDVNLDNTLTYVDPIGKYMEIKKVKSLLLFGKLYELVEAGDPIYYDQYGNEIDDDDAKENKNYAYVQQNYRIDANGDGKLTAEDDDDRYDIIINPCYSDDDNEVIFRLSQIEIYTKTTWDYRDPDIEDGNIRADTGGDQSLYVNIPVLALPVQKATIQLDINGNAISYTTNTDDKAQSTPLRVFYTVGVADAVKVDPENPDSAIDLAKLSSDYVAANKNIRTGEVYLYSNWYNSNKEKYTHYVTGAQTGYTFGDAVVTFSPDVDNSYYRYQEYLPIYTGDGTNADEVGKAYITDIDPEGSYHIITGYYKAPENPEDPESKPSYVEAIVNRIGAEFGSGIGTASFGEYLCWYNPTTGDVQTYTEKSNPPKDGYVLAARKNGVSIGDMSQNIGSKDDADRPGENNTNTSGTYYMPTISDSTSGDVLIVNIYLGNNGRLAVTDTQLLITKTVDRIGADDEYIQQEEFEYIIELKDKDGQPIGGVDINAVKVTAAGDGNWRSLIKKIELLTNNQGLLLNEGGRLATYSYNGKEYYVFVGGENEEQRFTHTLFEKNEENSLDDLLGSRNKASLNVEAYLVPIDSYSANWEMSEFDLTLVHMESFEVGEIDITQPIGYEINISKYQSSTTYDYTLLKFDADGLAKFTLKDGEGILLLGIDPGTQYTVTEKLTDEQAKTKGILLKSVKHVVTSQGTAPYYYNNMEESLIEADKYKFDNQAYEYTVTGATASLNRHEAHYCNFVPKAEKELLGDDTDKKIVNVGDTLEYVIYWENYHPDSMGGYSIADVVITDELELGLTFEKAEFVEPKAATVDGKTTVVYEAITNPPSTWETDAEHPISLDVEHIEENGIVTAVRWKITNAPAASHGYVRLTVTVNEDALKNFDPDTKDSEEYDYEISNKGLVEVGNGYSVETVPVDTTVTDVHKTEVEIITPEGKVIKEEDLELEIDDITGNYVGPKVEKGTQLKYRISFSNYGNEPTTITIKDRLDPDVAFVKAEYKTIYLDASENPEMNGKPQGVEDETVTITYYSSGTVEWIIENVPAHTTGEVYLTVYVSAEDPSIGADKDDDTGNGGEEEGGDSSDKGYPVDPDEEIDTKEYGTLKFEKVDITGTVVPKGMYLVVYKGSGDYAYLGNTVSRNSSDAYISGTTNNNGKESVVPSNNGNTITLTRSGMSFDPENIIWTVEQYGTGTAFYLKNNSNNNYLYGYYAGGNPELTIASNKTEWTYEDNGTLKVNNMSNPTFSSGYFGGYGNTNDFRVGWKENVSGVEFYQLVEVSDPIETDELYFPDDTYTFGKYTPSNYVAGAAVLPEGAYVIGVSNNVNYSVLNSGIAASKTMFNFVTAGFSTLNGVTVITKTVNNGEGKNIIWIVEYDKDVEYKTAKYFYLRNAENDQYLSLSSNQFSFVSDKSDATQWFINTGNNYNLCIYGTGTVIGPNISRYFSTSPWSSFTTEYFRTDLPVRPDPPKEPPEITDLPEEEESDEPEGIEGDYKIKNIASVKVNDDPKQTTETIENPMAGELIVEKQLFGKASPADRKKEFEFTIKLKASDGVEDFDPSVLSVIKTNEDGNETLEATWQESVNEEGVYSSTFKLKGGDAVHISGITCSIEYTVQEAEENNYTLCKITQNGEAVSDITDRMVSGTIDPNTNATEKVVFYNESQIVTLPATGGMGTQLFYLLGGLLALGAFLWFVITKRKTVL